MTPNFKLEEFIRSDVARVLGVDNTPPPEVMVDLQRTAEGLERLRAVVDDLPIQILSGYRCLSLNRAVNGSLNSQHMKGQAADIICPKLGPVDTFARIIAVNAKALGVDQVIKERNGRGALWVHVSFTLTPRHEALTLTTAGLVAGIV